MTTIPQPDPRQIVAAYRYLVFLDQERRALVYELLPDHKLDDPVFFPVDSLVGTLTDTSPIERAVSVLEGLGLDPYADDAWVEHIGVDMSSIPIINEYGKPLR